MVSVEFQLNGMKFLVDWLLICLVFIPLQSFAQEPVGAIELPEFNVLYRGYPNKVIPAITNNGDAHLILVGTNCSISKSENSDFFTVVPDKSKTATIALVLNQDGRLDTVRRIHYRVLNLPDPLLYWGPSKQDTKADLHELLLFAKYPPEVPLNAQFSIVEWSIIGTEDTISDVGSNLRKADSLFRTFNLPTSVTIRTIVVGPDGIRRVMIGNWFVDAWTERRKELKPIGCG